MHTAAQKAIEELKSRYNPGMDLPDILEVIRRHFADVPDESELVKELREEKARLDWLDTQKSEHHATWDSPPSDSDGEGGGPAYWVNPSVSWQVRALPVKCGTYEFPPVLKSMTVREAIDAAIVTEAAKGPKHG